MPSRLRPTLCWFDAAIFNQVHSQQALREPRYLLKTYLGVCVENYISAFCGILFGIDCGDRCHTQRVTCHSPHTHSEV